MLKRLSAVLLVFTLLFVAGCSSGDTPATTTTQPANVDMLRRAEIGGQWSVVQLRINLVSGIPLMLKLNPGESVEGYFYLEKGIDVDFAVSGKTAIYQSVSPYGVSGNITSDRFSFVASDTQGIAYTLTFTPVITDSKSVTPVVFMEIIMPKDVQLFNPMGTE